MNEPHALLRPAVSGMVTFKLVLTFFLAIPLTAAGLLFALLFLLEWLISRSALMPLRQFATVFVLYSLPVALFVAPVAFSFYRRKVGTMVVTQWRLARYGAAIGAGVPLFIAVVLGLADMYFKSIGVWINVTLAFSLGGLILGPIVALIYGPILRRIDPRYR